MSGPRQLVRARDVRGGIDEDSRLHSGPCSSARARPNDPPYHVAEVHHDDDEHDHGEADPDAVPEGMVFGETVQPVAEVIPSLDQPAEDAMPVHPLEFGTREDMPHNVTERIARDLHRARSSLESQRAPSCSLRISMSNASRRTRKS